MGTLSFLFDKDIKSENLPWYNLPSIYGYIKNSINSEGDLPDAAEPLPDEERRFKDGELRWIAGGIDGAFGHHFGGTDDTKKAKKLVSLLREITRKDSLAKKVELYNILLADDLLDYIDPAVEQILASDIFSEPHFHEFVRWLAQEGTDRGPVKFALALLGVIGDANDLDTVMLLGKHEEFTLYSAVAITNMLEDPVPQLWELARHVHGWGRIHLVERLSESDNPEIQGWLLREGYKNRIMYEYLAYVCATTGDLKSALSSEMIDDELLLSAGELIDALIRGGPAEDINDYQDAPDVLQSYLRHLEPRADQLEQFIIVHTVYDYLSQLKENWKERKKQGWTLEIRNTLLQTAQRIIQCPQWREFANSKLSSQDDFEFYTASRAAELLGIDTWDVHWKKLQDNPYDSGRWYDIMKKANDDRIKDIIDFALAQLPLDTIATGPANELGLGKEYNIHSCLDFILQDLGKFPGLGFPLIQAGLKSPVTRNRNMAVRALSYWGEEHWNSDVAQVLQNALENEPDNDLKEKMQRVIEGGYIEEE